MSSSFLFPLTGCTSALDRQVAALPKTWLGAAGLPWLISFVVPCNYLGLTLFMEENFSSKSLIRGTTPSAANMLEGTRKQSCCPSDTRIKVPTESGHPEGSPHRSWEK